MWPLPESGRPSSPASRGTVRSTATPATELVTTNTTVSTLVDVAVEVVAMTLPRSPTDPRTSFSPARMVSFPRSEEKRPVDRTVNANTDATTTKAIRMMDVSNPVMPSRALNMLANLAFIRNGTAFSEFIS